MDAEYSFSLLKFYYGEITELLSRRAKDFREYTDKQEEEHKRIQRPFDKEYVLKHYDVYSEYYPNIFRNSFITTACALFEFQIKKLCELIKEEHRIPLEWDDMKGSVPTRTKRFLGFAGILLKDDPPGSDQYVLSVGTYVKPMTIKQLWNELENYFLVRNCITHHNGLIQKMRNPERLTSYASKKRLIKEDGKQIELQLTQDFNKEVCETMMRFFSKLNSAYYSTPLPG